MTKLMIRSFCHSKQLKVNTRIILNIFLICMEGMISEENNHDAKLLTSF